MKKKKPKRAQEAKTLCDMIAIYCRGNHHTKGKTLCPACSALQTYALQRLQHCRYGDEKSFCSLCPTHCYAPKQREEIRRVMRYAGPRSLFVHPVAALRHLTLTIRAKNLQKKEQTHVS